ncbi:MAG: hypothetical protein GY925_21255 [Actinomycetia bacterium]|nr:hypothetical protein [Actinomycetes bacterium]
MERAHPKLRIDNPAGTRLSNGERRLTFGRSADLVVDENPFMHRVVGAFELQGDVWMLTNEGASTSVTLVDDTGRRVVLPPGARAALTAPKGSLRWRSGKGDYTLGYEVERPPLPNAVPAVHDAPPTATLIPPLTGREIDFMVTMARHVLVGSTLPVPTYAQVAHLWDVRTKTVDNTIQNLKAKLGAAGVPVPATTDELVALLVDAGTISMRNMKHADLDGHAGPRRAQSTGSSY